MYLFIDSFNCLQNVKPDPVRRVHLCLLYKKKTQCDGILLQTLLNTTLSLGRMEHYSKSSLSQLWVTFLSVVSR